jgi:predicted PurR-regulated permease PerM
MTEKDSELFEGKPPPAHHPHEFAENDPLRNEPPPANVAPVVVPRWVQLVTLPLAIVALWVIARAAGVVLLVFVTAAVVALILNPLVLFLQRRGHMPRGLAVAAVYIGLLSTLTGVGFLLANPIADQADRLSQDVPRLVDSANESLDSLQKTFDDRGINIEIKRQGATAVQTLAEKLGAASNDVASTATDLLRTIVTASLGVLLVIVLSVYMLVYGERIGAHVRRVMPPGDGTPEDDYPTRVQRAVAGYIRGQLLFSTAMGLGAGLGLFIYGKLGIFDLGDDYALAFGIFFGLMELVPFVGPILGALPPIIVALFQDPLTAVWVALLFVALQQIEGHVVAPQIFGKALRINPLLVIFALLLGGEVYGVLGALLALPLAAVARETVVYLRRHLVLEPWGPDSPLPLRAPPPVVCDECGQTAARGDSYCRSCGAPLGSPVVSRQ